MIDVLSRELHLQIKLIELQSLLAQAQHEPRLKGPFPVELYRRILVSLQTILDKLHSMRCVTTREEWYCHSSYLIWFLSNCLYLGIRQVVNCNLNDISLDVSAIFQDVRQDFIIPVNKERREMVGNIMLSFSTLASAFRLKAPLPAYLPPVEKARLRLV